MSRFRPHSHAADVGIGTLDALSAEARACRVCAAVLPLGPRPVFQVSATARLLIASQAPGTRVHESGIPYTDASGARLREWLGIPESVFYDAARVAILPMGFCYPGRVPNGGDAPPRPECAPLWRARFLAAMPSLRLTLLVGLYAQDWYARAWMLGRGTMTERVRDFRNYLPRSFPLPHPSWRSLLWERKNPWFREEVLPALRREVARILSSKA
ncbi:MAG TPA: uracil-DNA glycosylase family protein [Acetobacteraceae bacterium]|nr:uracil-DNA glycosylase family protein [Acetobacteraceae bacterium]